MKPSSTRKITPTPSTADFSKIVFPQPWPLTEEHLSNFALHVPVLAKVFSCYVVRILAAYDIGPQPPKNKEVAAIALQASEAVDAFVKAMEDISREEFPDALWLRRYATAAEKIGEIFND
jgi:hypothetical protein